MMRMMVIVSMVVFIVNVDLKFSRLSSNLVSRGLIIVLRLEITRKAVTMTLLC